MSETTIKKLPLKQLVPQMIKDGYTYRHIAEKLNLKSTNTVAYYAKNVHQHRLIQIIDSEEFKCTKCEMYFKPMSEHKPHKRNGEVV